MSVRDEQNLVNRLNVRQKPRGTSNLKPAVQKPKTLASSNRMYQKTLHQQNAKNVYEHLHKDSERREYAMVERKLAQ